MINISDSLKEKLQNNTHRTLSVIWQDGTITSNTNIYSESLTITQSLCDEDDVRFGKCNASQLEIILGGLDLSCIGKWFELRLYVSNTTEYLSLGKYKVDSAERQDDKSFRKITAYDSMRLLQKDVSDWYAGQNFDQITHADMLKSLLNYCGLAFIQSEINNLVNGQINVSHTVNASKLTGLQVAEAILEVSGVFGTIDNLGNFRIVNAETGGLYPDTVYPDEAYPNEIMADYGVGTYFTKSDYSKCDYEEYITMPINALQIHTDENDIGYVIHASGDENIYVVTDNFLLYGKSNDELSIIAHNLMSVIGGFSYRPFELSTHNTPWLELGDCVKVECSDGVQSPIMYQTISGIQSFSITYGAKGNLYLENDVEGSNTTIEQLRGLTNSLVRTVEETVSTLRKVEYQGSVYESTIQQLAEQILMRVTKGRVSSQISVESDKVAITGNRLIIDADNFHLTSDGVMSVNNGYIGKIRIGSEGLSSEDYVSMKIVANPTTNDYQVMSQRVYVAPQCDSTDRETKYFPRIEMNYDSASNQAMLLGANGSGGNFAQTPTSLEFVSNDGSKRVKISVDNDYGFKATCGNSKVEVNTTEGNVSASGTVYSNANVCYGTCVVGGQLIVLSSTSTMSEVDEDVNDTSDVGSISARETVPAVMLDESGLYIGGIDALTPEYIGALSEDSIIERNELSEDVQSSLDKADSAIQDVSNKLGDFVTVSEVTISGVKYKTYWQVAPTSSNTVYGVAVHPTNGKLCRIYNNKGKYSVTTYDANTQYTFSTGDENGQIKVTSNNSTIAPQNVSVKGFVDLTVTTQELSASNITGGTLKIYTSGHNVQIVADALVLSDNSAISTGLTPIIPTASGHLNSFSNDGAFMWTSSDGTLFFNITPNTQYWGSISLFI